MPQNHVSAIYYALYIYIYLALTKKNISYIKTNTNISKINQKKLCVVYPSHINRPHLLKILKYVYLDAGRYWLTQIRVYLHSHFTINDISVHNIYLKSSYNNIQCINIPSHYGVREGLSINKINKTFLCWPLIHSLVVISSLYQFYDRHIIF